LQLRQLREKIGLERRAVPDHDDRIRIAYGVQKRVASQSFGIEIDIGAREHGTPIGGLAQRVFVVVEDHDARLHGPTAATSVERPAARPPAQHAAIAAPAFEAPITGSASALNFASSAASDIGRSSEPIAWSTRTWSLRPSSSTAVTSA